ncbi:DUF6286 domain-containing Asp23/Gls24 family envelope stress response protein [Streptomyces sp. NPDC001422]|uniref:DUF6286 domain-containing Asp23/Gls24 family envelope stress response protein n=1 Tax=Streptomyces sp. NPDC001422 TaxID=3364575 RepID=UPI00367793F2
MTDAAVRGTTTVSEKAVRKIAERAAAEALPGFARPSARGSASVRGRRAVVSLGVTLPYPAPLASTAERVERHVTDRTGRLTGLRLEPARVTVTGLTGPARPSAPPLAKPPASGRAPRRSWSARRVPVVGLALAAALVCGAAAVDVLRVHLAGQPPAAWRTDLLDALERRGPADLPVAFGIVLAAAGLWLCVLALTPGRRGLLGAASPGLYAAVDRTAVASVIRDAVADVPGTDSVRVRVGRGRARVRVALAFGERDAATEAAAAAAHRAMDACALRRAPRLRVTVRPAPTWQPPGSGPGSPESRPTEPRPDDPRTGAPGPHASRFPAPTTGGPTLAGPRSVEHPSAEPRLDGLAPADPPARSETTRPAGSEA